MGGNVQRRLNIVVGIDSGPMDPGIQRALAKEKAFVAEARQINTSLERSTVRYQKASQESIEADKAVAGISKYTGKADVWERQGRQQIASARLNESQAALQSAIAVKQNEQEKQALQDRLLRMDAEGQEAARLKAVEHNQVRALSDRTFALTHNQREIDLRSARRYYAEIKLEHRGNATMLAQIDRAYAIERDVIMGRGTGVLNVRAGRQVGRMMAADAAGMLSPELGQAASYGAMARMSGASAGTALAIGGAALAAAVIMSTYKNIQESAKAQAEWSKESEKSAERIRQSMSMSMPTTRAGSQYEGAVSAAQDRLKETSEREKKYASMTAQQWRQEYEEGRDPAAIQAAAIAERKEAEFELKVFRQQATAMKDKASAQTISAGAAGVEATRIGAMADGPAKRAAALAQAHAEEVRKANEEYTNMGDSFTAARMSAAGKGPGALESIVKDQERYEKEFVERQKQMTERQGIERPASDRQNSDEIHAERVSAQQALIAVTESGYAREVALLELKHQEEMASYEKAGKDKASLIERQSAEAADITLRRDREVADIVTRQRTDLAVVTGKMSASDAEWAAEERRLSQDLNLSADAIARIKKGFDQLAGAQAAKPLLDEMKQLQLQIAYSRRDMDAVEYNKQRIMLANPKASGEDAYALANMQEKARAQDWAKGQMESLDPVEAWRSKKRDIDAALRTGSLGKGATGLENAKLLAEKELKGLIGGGGRSGGQFTGGSEHWQATQSALMGQDDIPERMAKGIETLVSIQQDVKRDGYPLRG